MLEPVDMLPTPLVPSMLPRERLRPMLDFSMEDMDMDLVLAMLDTAMESQLMDTLLLATTVKDLLMLMLDIFMVATDMDLVLAMVLDTVDTTTDKLAAATYKSSKAIICYSVPIWVGIG